MAASGELEVWVYVLIGLGVLLVLLILITILYHHCYRNSHSNFSGRGAGFKKTGSPYALAREIQNLIGPIPEVKVERFSNWASTQVVEGALTVRPRTVAEVQLVINAARHLGLQIRAAAKTHSWTPFFHSGHNRQIIMHVGEIQRPGGAPKMELMQDQSGGIYVTVATGVTTKEFLNFQLQNGITVPANVVLRDVTLGGIVAGACHGVGRDLQTFSDRVVKMRLVDSSGELRTYSIEEDPDMMRALHCNLGLWGIMIDITFKVEPMIIVNTENHWLKLRDIFYNKENFRNIVMQNWSVEIFWFPYNSITNWEGLEAFVQKEIHEGEWDPLEDELLVRVVNKTSQHGPLVGDHVYAANNYRDYVYAKGFDKVDGFVSSFPAAGPSFLRQMLSRFKKIFNGTLTQQLPHAIHYVDYVEVVPVWNMEWAFSVDPDFTNICHAVQRVVELVYAEAKEGRFAMNLPLEMRFIADSNVYMAPAICGNKEYGGSGLTCYIETLTIEGTVGYEEYCTKVYHIWKNLQGARPHWCKWWSFLPDIHNFIRQAYAQQIPKFLAALERSGADPHGMFFPSNLEKIFYPQGHPGKHFHPHAGHAGKMICPPGHAGMCTSALAPSVVHRQRAPCTGYNNNGYLSNSHSPVAPQVGQGTLVVLE